MKLYVYALLSICSLGVMSMHAEYGAKRIQKKVQPCKCYCSVKCGPRDMRRGDKPFVDDKTGVCFCAPRDKRLFHQCDVTSKEIKTEMKSLKTCCKK